MDKKPTQEASEEQAAAKVPSTRANRGGQRSGAGRKETTIDLAIVEKLSVLHCTEDEIAAVVGVSARTIRKRRRDPKFAEAISVGRAKGRISVRRKQMQLLEGGSPTMAIWLGKHFLGQREVTPVELTGANGQPVQVSLDVLDGALDEAEKSKKNRKNH